MGSRHWQNTCGIYTMNSNTRQKIVGIDGVRQRFRDITSSLEEVFFFPQKEGNQGSVHGGRGI